MSVKLDGVRATPATTSRIRERFAEAICLLFVISALGLAGCAGLPSTVNRPLSRAETGGSQTSLGNIAKASQRGHDATESGFRLLSYANYALETRLDLARRAERTVDVQYYLIQNDITGRRFLRELRDAAARGVRIRVLVDDLYTAGEDPLLAGLASYPNVEVRLFNPFVGGRSSLLTRFAYALTDEQRVNHRMHNKMFIVDNVAAVTGGRNIADEYFMRSATNNFVDLDLFEIGPVVQELSAVFDRYWNSTEAYPLFSIIPTPDVLSARATFDSLTASSPDPKETYALDYLGHLPIATELNSGRLELDWAVAKVLADSPDKVTGVNRASLEGTVTRGVVDAMAQARTEVFIGTPYFIPGDYGMRMMKRATDDHVKVRVFTNSLAATDEPLVHAEYAKYRLDMLQIGVEILEISPSLSQQSGKLGAFSRSFGRFHAKVALIDQKRVYIGSMNLDPRSAYENTEVGLLIDSPELCSEILRLIAIDDRASLYELRLNSSKDGIQWVSRIGGREEVFDQDPETSWWQRMELQWLPLLTPEELL